MKTINLLQDAIDSLRRCIKNVDEEIAVIKRKAEVLEIRREEYVEDLADMELNLVKIKGE